MGIPSDFRLKEERKTDKEFVISSNLAFDRFLNLAAVGYKNGLIKIVSTLPFKTT